MDDVVNAGGRSVFKFIGGGVEHDDDDMTTQEVEVEETTYPLVCGRCERRFGSIIWAARHKAKDNCKANQDSSDVFISAITAFTSEIMKVERNKPANGAGVVGSVVLDTNNALNHLYKDSTSVAEEEEEEEEEDDDDDDHADDEEEKDNVIVPSQRLASEKMDASKPGWASRAFSSDDLVLPDIGVVVVAAVFESDQTNGVKTSNNTMRQQIMARVRDSQLRWDLQFLLTDQRIGKAVTKVASKDKQQRQAFRKSLEESVGSDLSR